MHTFFSYEHCRIHLYTHSGGTPALTKKQADVLCLFFIVFLFFRIYPDVRSHELYLSDHVDKLSVASGLREDIKYFFR